MYIDNNSNSLRNELRYMFSNDLKWDIKKSIYIYISINIYLNVKCNFTF